MRDAGSISIELLWGGLGLSLLYHGWNRYKKEEDLSALLSIKVFTSIRIEVYWAEAVVISDVTQLSIRNVAAAA